MAITAAWCWERSWLMIYFIIGVMEDLEQCRISAWQLSAQVDTDTVFILCRRGPELTVGSDRRIGLYLSEEVQQKNVA